MRIIPLLPVLFIALLSACASADAPKSEEMPTTEEFQAPENPFPNPQPDSIAADTSRPVGKVEKPDMKAPAIKFETQVYNFDSIKAGEVLNFDFKFTNVGERPLEIAKVNGSCGCTVGSWPFLLIAKGESGVIKARFDSKGKKGKQENTLTVYSNAELPEMILTIKGFVREGVESNKAGK